MRERTEENEENKENEENEEFEENEENEENEEVDPLKHMELFEEIKGYLYKVYIDDIILNSLNCCDLSMYINREEDIEWVKSNKEYISEKRKECQNEKWEEEYRKDIRIIENIIDRYMKSNKELKRRVSWRDEKNLIDFIYSYSEDFPIRM
jgi:hypothetical protein